MDKYMNIYEDDDEEIEDKLDIKQHKSNLSNDDSIKLESDNYNTNDRIVYKTDKIRNIPHIEGNFACSIYFKLQLSNKISNFKDRIYENLKTIIDKRNDKVNILTNGLKINEIDKNDLHISFSTNFFLKYHQTLNFLNILKENLQNSSIIKNGFDLLLLKNLRYFKNEYHTRYFISMEILKSNRLKELLSIINKILLDFNIPILYKVFLIIFIIGIPTSFDHIMVN